MDLLNDEHGRARSIARIVSDTCYVPLVELMGPGRRPRLVRIRHIAMYLARKHTQLSYPQLGQLFRRDHSSIQHACRRIKELIKTDATTAGQIAQIEERVLEELPPLMCVA